MQEHGKNPAPRLRGQGHWVAPGTKKQRLADAAPVGNRAQRRAKKSRQRREGSR